jgi:hypothetical protein
MKQSRDMFGSMPLLSQAKSLKDSLAAKGNITKSNSTELSKVPRSRTVVGNSFEDVKKKPTRSDEEIEQARKAGKGKGLGSMHLRRRSASSLASKKSVEVIIGSKGKRVIAASDDCLHNATNEADETVIAMLKCLAKSIDKIEKDFQLRKTTVSLQEAQNVQKKIYQLRELLEISQYYSGEQDKQDKFGATKKNKGWLYQWRQKFKLLFR